jgi:hypothetical protein
LTSPRNSATSPPFTTSSPLSERILIPLPRRFRIPTPISGSVLVPAEREVISRSLSRSSTSPRKTRNRTSAWASVVSRSIWM